MLRLNTYMVGFVALRSNTNVVGFDALRPNTNVVGFGAQGYLNIFSSFGGTETCYNSMWRMKSCLCGMYP